MIKIPEDSIPLSDDYSAIERPVSDDLCVFENDVMSLYYNMLQNIYGKCGNSGIVLAEIIKAFIMPSGISLEDTITIGEGIAHIEILHGELFLYILGQHVPGDKQIYVEAMIARIAEEDWEFIDCLLPVALRCEEILDIAKRSFLAGKLNAVERAWNGYNTTVIKDEFFSWAEGKGYISKEPSLLPEERTTELLDECIPQPSTSESEEPQSKVEEMDSGPLKIPSHETALRLAGEWYAQDMENMALHVGLLLIVGNKTHREIYECVWGKGASDVKAPVRSVQNQCNNFIKIARDRGFDVEKLVKRQ